MFEEDFEEAIESVLVSPQVQVLLGEATELVPAADIRRELRSRRKDIEFDVSREGQQVDVARRFFSAAQDEVDRRLRYRLSVIVAIVSAVIGGLVLIAGAVLFFRRSDLVRPVFGAWLTPFWTYKLNSPMFWAPFLIWVGGVSLAVLIVSLVWKSSTQASLQNRLTRAHGADRALSGLRDAQAVFSTRLEEQVRKAVIEILNEARKGPNRATRIFVSEDVPAGRRTIGLGLSEAPSSESLTASSVQKRLIGFIKEMPSGNFGVSGPRGVGKSTLLASICESDLEISGRSAITINTAAPVEYDSRDFLLHLFSTLCRKVLRREQGFPVIDSEMLIREPMSAWRTGQLRRLAIPIAGALAIFSVCMGLMAIGIARWVDEKPFPAASAPTVTAKAPQAVKGAASNAASAGKAAQDQKPAIKPSEAEPSASMKLLQAQIGPMALFSLTAMAAALVLVMSAMLARSRRPILEAFPGEPIGRRSVVSRSMTELGNIRFQRSFTSGWSGALKAPAALEFGFSGSLAFAQQPESLPELVERFRQYVELLVSEYGRVVIGIDELDKLKSAKEAEVFLNSVKAVFNIPGCFFLVSVSEHALASFDRRGLGFRDAFDSALDQVVQIDYCDLDGSRALLRARILRWPEPFLHLSHMLSGGLPRDLIRSARSIINIADGFGHKGATLKAVAESLVAEEARAKIRATSIAIRQIDENHDATDLLMRIARISEFDTIAQLSERVLDFRHALSSDMPPADKVGRNHLLCQELGVYLGMLVQVHRVSGLAQSSTGFQALMEADLLLRVTQVRQALEVSMPLAAARLDDAEVHIGQVERRIGAARAASRAVLGVSRNAKGVESAKASGGRRTAKPGQKA